jgi:hypothetical protein
MLANLKHFFLGVGAEPGDVGLYSALPISFFAVIPLDFPNLSCNGLIRWGTSTVKDLDAAPTIHEYLSILHQLSIK